MIKCVISPHSQTLTTPDDAVKRSARWILVLKVRSGWFCPAVLTPPAWTRSWRTSTKLLPTTRSSASWSRLDKVNPHRPAESVESFKPFSTFKCSNSVNNYNVQQTWAKNHVQVSSWSAVAFRIWSLQISFDQNYWTPSSSLLSFTLLNTLNCQSSV